MHKPAVDNEFAFAIVKSQVGLCIRKSVGFGMLHKMRYAKPFDSVSGFAKNRGQACITAYIHFCKPDFIIFLSIDEFDQSGNHLLPSFIDQPVT